MAHQYSSAPPYGAQYPAAPYYSPFAPAAGQQTNNGTPGLPQSGIHHSNLPTTLSNTVRYDANAQLQSQPAALPFGPHFNPGLLKHFPPPPPPLPPTAHFGNAPGNAIGFMNFPQAVNTPPHQGSQQNYPHFAQSLIPLSAGSLPGQNVVSAHEQRPYNQFLPTQDDETSADQLRKQFSPSRIATNKPVIEPSSARLFDGTGGGGGYEAQPYTSQRRETSIDRSFGDMPASNELDEQANYAPPIMNFSNVELDQQIETDAQLPRSKPRSPSELRERAKAALLSLVPHNIRYNDFLAEGVTPQVLQMLYEELGLNWRAAEAKPDKTATISKAVPKLDSLKTPQENLTSLQIPQLSTSATSAIAKLSPAATPASRASPTLNPSIERKDRIAQLLAAKAGKANAPSLMSKSQSHLSVNGVTQPPAPEAEAKTSVSTVHLPKPTRSLAQAEVVRQKMEQLKKETMAKVKAEQPHNVPKNTISRDRQLSSGAENSPTNQPILLPTPVREHLMQNGFSSLIPGLFMTSSEPDDTRSRIPSHDDQELYAEADLSSATDALVHQPSKSIPVSTVHSPQSPRKRSIAGDSSGTGDYPQAKRQAIETDDDSNDTSMEVDEGVEDEISEGEIAEDEQPNQEERRLSSGKPVVPSIQTDHARHNSVVEQMELDTTRKRIAEVEQRQSSKRGQSYVLSPAGSMTSMPTYPITSQTSSNSPLSKLGDLPFAGPKATDPNHQSPRSLTKATPEQLAEREAQLKAFLRQRALRQKQLQEGIPALNDQVAKTQSRLKQTRADLAQVRVELQQFEASICSAREKERQLLQEIDQLEKQISDGESGQKQFSNELSNLKQQSTGDTADQSFKGSSTAEQPTQPTTNVTLHVSEDSSKETDNGKTFGAHNELLASTTVDTPQGDELKTTSSHTREQSSEIDQHQTNGELIIEADILDPNENGDQNEGREVSAPSLVTNSHMQFEDQTEEQDDDSDEAMEESDGESDDSRMSIDEDSNDSISMSNSGSDDYEPAEPELSLRVDEKIDSDEYEPEVEGGQQSDGVAEEEGSDYEPAEDIEPTEDISPGEMSEVSTTSTTVHTPSDPTTRVAMQELKNGPSVEPSLAISQVGMAKGLQADDLENGLQLSEADTLTKPQNVSTDEETDGSHVLGAAEPSPVRYVPYQSPLSSLKSYRFHPFFNEQVKTGYRSLTYSHKIDSKLPICPTELGGVACTDQECQNQHFSSMALTDDKILVQMSSASDIKDKGLRDQFLIGLKQVIARLRREGVKEFSAVADALSQYRREWTVAQASS